MQTSYIRMLYKSGLNSNDIDLLIKLKKRNKSISFNKEV
jgi:hypothetical protein